MLVVFLPGTVALFISLLSLSVWLPQTRSDVIKKGVFVYTLAAFVIAVMGMGIAPYSYGIGAVLSLFGTAVMLPVCLVALFFLSQRIPKNKG